MGASRAPFGNLSYEFWSLPGIWNVQQKTGAAFDRIYEVHSAKKLTKLKIPAEKGLWMQDHVTHVHPTLKASFKDAEIIDFEAHIEKYGPYFTSSLAWMIAEAIEYGADSIHIYGVTMSADGEYAHQKPSCSYLIGWARANGIDVVVDRGSELMSAPWIYGYEDEPDILTGLRDKCMQIEQEMQKHEQHITDLKANFHRMEGQREQIKWYENNWFSGVNK